jgi:hypothetical protein
MTDCPTALERFETTECANPLCHSEFDQTGTRMQPRRYCSDSCKFTAWLIKRMREITADMSDADTIKLIRNG